MRRGPLERDPHRCQTGILPQVLFWVGHHFEVSEAVSGPAGDTDESTAPGRVPEQGLVAHVLETLPLLETRLGMGMDRVAVVDLVGGNQLEVRDRPPRTAGRRY